MADYGPTRRFWRAKVPIRVIIGDSPTEPGKVAYLTKGKDGEAIKSGMAMLRDGSDEFIKATTAGNASSQSVYIARHDQDSLDVQAANGKLVGLDCSDNYVVQTGYYKSGETYTKDLELTVFDNGEFGPAANGDLVCARINSVGGEASGAHSLGGFSPSALDNTVIELKTVSPYIKG